MSSDRVAGYPAMSSSDGKVEPRFPPIPVSDRPQRATRQSEQLAIVLLFAFGVLFGLATAPTIAYYVNTNRKRSGKPAARQGSSSPGSARPGMRPDEISPSLRACSSGR
jgi:hypothetical protein